MQVCVVGATGTIGRATVAALVARGYAVTCLLRRPDAALSAQTSVIEADVASPAALTAVLVQGRFDAIVSCLASRTGVPADAWAVDHCANLNVLEAAQRSGVQHFILLSAICVQQPLLAFQHAKLAFQSALAASGICYSIVRPTVFFKSLSGQMERVRKGKPFLIFANGELTARWGCLARSFRGWQPRQNWRASGAIMPASPCSCLIPKRGATTRRHPLPPAPTPCSHTTVP